MNKPLENTKTSAAPPWNLLPPLRISCLPQSSLPRLFGPRSGSLLQEIRGSGDVSVSQGKNIFTMGGSHSVEIPGGGMEGYHVLRVR